MADEYIATSADLTAVADAIRSKGGTSSRLVFPDGYVSAVNAITTGGTSESRFSPRDTVTDWQADNFLGVYFTFDSSLPEGHPLRRLNLELQATKKNESNYTVTMGYIQDGVYIVKETVSGWLVNGYIDIAVPIYSESVYTTVRIIPDSVANVTSLVLAQNMWATNIVDRYGNMPTMASWHSAGYSDYAGWRRLIRDGVKTGLRNDMNAFYRFMNSLAEATAPRAGNPPSYGKSAANAFNGCYSLTTLDLGSFDTTSVTNMSSMFNNCYSLTDFESCVWYKSISFSSSSKLTHDSLMSIINNLATVTSKQTLTIGATNKAKLTDDEIAVATEKGWTVA
jgi:surface protein